jgi:MFS family permease
MKRWKARLGFPETRGKYGFLLVFIIDALGSGLFLPFSILYFQVTAGFALPVIGLTLTIATICTLPTTLVTGSLVDRFGARRMTAISQLIQAGGFIGYLFFVHTIPLMFIMVALVTAGTRMFYAATATLVVELAAPRELDRWFGFVGAIRNVGLGIGGFLAGFVLATNNPDFYRLLIGICAICYLLAGFLLLSLPELQQTRSEQETRAPYGQILHDHLFLKFLVSNIAFILCILMLGTSLPVYVTEAWHAPAWILGPALTLNSLLVIGCQTLVVRLLEPYRRTRTIGMAALVWCLSCGLFALASIIPGSFIILYLFLAVAIHTLASLLYGPTVSALIADISPPTLRGRYLATYEFAWGIASALMPALFTTLYAVTPTLPWISLIVMAAVSGVSVLFLERKFTAQVRGDRREMEMLEERPEVDRRTQV